MESIGDRLKQEIEQYARGSIRSTRLFLAAEQGELTSQHIARYVSGLHLLVRGNMSLMRHAMAGATTAGNSPLAAHYRQKICEESGHERWAERDLERLPSQSTEYGSNIRETAIPRLIAYLHAAIDRDPCLLLSYMLLAEYLTVLVGGEWLDAVQKNCGVSRSRITILANHVELDRKHATEGARAIDRLTTLRKRDPMLDVLRTCIGYYEAFWDEIHSVTLAA